jgi:chloride channel protein, CIC family
MAARRTHGRLGVLAALAALVGLVVGGVAWLLVRLIGGLTNLALLHRVGWSLPPLEDLEPSAWLPAVAVGGALVVSLLARWAPAIRGHGIPEAMEAVLTRQSRVNPRTAVAKPISIAVSIGTGGPFGAEGPIIVTGGALGSLLGQVVPVTPSERKILLGCGAAAGTAAIFGAPLAAVVLAFELLLFEFSTRVIVPLVVAASVAGGAHVALFGPEPLFRVKGHDFSGLGQLWLFALLGLGCGLLAVVLCRGLFVVEALYRRLPIGQFWHPAIGALGFAAVGLVVPRALGTGYPTIQDTLADRLALGTLALVLGAKLVAWWLALGSGTSGSTLAPIILVGGAFGALFGNVADRLLPGIDVSVGAMALVAMAALFGASVGASFTAIVFAFELTRDYEAILPLMLATVVADLVASALLDHNLMTEKLARQGVPVPRGYEPDVLRHTLVAGAMTSPADTLPSDVTVAEARRHIAGGTHHAYPLVSADGGCAGIVTRGDLLADAASDDVAVTTVASRDVVTVGPGDSMLDALERLIDEEVDQLPVVDGGRLVGICTRTDVLRARSRHLTVDTLDRQPPWTPPWPGRRRRQRVGISGREACT